MPGPSAPCGESEKARENAFDASPVPRITLRLRLSYDPGARPQRRSMSGAFSGENRVGRMFTGIIQGKHEIVVFERSGDSARLGVRLPPELREALDRLRLSDPAIVSQPEQSTALGFGFRCGFLGVLHMDIVRERLEREFGLELVITTPQVEYELEHRDATVTVLDSPGAVSYTHLTLPTILRV